MSRLNLILHSVIYIAHGPVTVRAKIGLLFAVDNILVKFRVVRLPTIKTVMQMAGATKPDFAVVFFTTTIRASIHYLLHSLYTHQRQKSMLMPLFMACRAVHSIKQLAQFLRIIPQVK